MAQQSSSNLFENKWNMERELVFKMFTKSKNKERNGEESKADTTHPMIKMSLLREKSVPAESPIHKLHSRR